MVRNLISTFAVALSMTVGISLLLSVLYVSLDNRQGTEIVSEKADCLLKDETGNFSESKENECKQIIRDCSDSSSCDYSISRTGDGYYRYSIREKGETIELKMRDDFVPVSGRRGVHNI